MGTEALLSETILEPHNTENITLRSVIIALSADRLRRLCNFLLANLSHWPVLTLEAV